MSTNVNVSECTNESANVGARESVKERKDASYPFWKLHGLGNDFVFFDAMQHEIELTTEEVATLCDRHTGIGGDGVIVVKPSPRPECAAYMHYINADGTLAQMCGNGVRCFAKFLVDHGYVAAGTTEAAEASGTAGESSAEVEGAGVGTGEFVADTLSGPKPITFTTDSEGKLATATVDMGAPILTPADVPVNAEANAAVCGNTTNMAADGVATDVAVAGSRADEMVGDAANADTKYLEAKSAGSAFAGTALEGVGYVTELPIESPWGTFEFTCVSMGNPHAVCFLDDEKFASLPAECFSGNPNDQTVRRSLANFDVSRVGAFFESHEVFPEKTNVEFAVVESPESIHMRVFERGCGETHACGTGACATQVAAHLAGKTSAEADLRLLGGTLNIALKDGHVIMTGPAAEAFCGTVTPSALVPRTEHTSA